MSLFQNIILSFIFIIIGSILDPYIKNIWLKVSRTYQEKNIQKKIIFDNTVKFVINNPHEETILRIRFLQRALAPLVSIIISILLLVTKDVLLSILAFLINIAIIYQIHDTRKLGNIIDEVNRRKLKANPNIDLDIKLPKENKVQENHIRKTSHGKKKVTVKGK